MKIMSLFRLLVRRFMRGDRQAGFTLLRRAGSVLAPDYRFVDPRLDWWHDERFNSFLERFDEMGGLNADRKFMVAQLLRLTEHIPGNTAECGVFAGASSLLICCANEGTEKQHHVFDSFEGLSTPGGGDGVHWQGGDLAFPLEKLRASLAGFEKVELHKGWIPERFPDVADQRFSFVHIDVDLEAPTLQSVEFFYPRMNDGGILICDDYGFETCPGATTAVDGFLKDKPEKMVRLPGGAGFLIKGRRTTDRMRSESAAK
jgi:O-methyltransferase